MRRAALASGILAQTQQNADKLLVPLLSKLSEEELDALSKALAPLERIAE